MAPNQQCQSNEGFSVIESNVIILQDLIDSPTILSVD